MDLIDLNDAINLDDYATQSRWETEICKHVDLKTLNILLRTSKQFYTEGTSDSVWGPKIAGLHIPNEFNNLVNASNCLQFKLETCYDTFLRIFNLLTPLIRTPTAMESKLKTARAILNAKKFIQCFEELYTSKEIADFNEFVVNEQNALLEQIDSDSISAIEVYNEKDLKEKLFKAYFNISTEPNFEAFMSKVVQLKDEILSPEYILPSKWNEEAFLFVLKELITQLKPALNNTDLSLLHEKSKVLLENEFVNTFCFEKFNLDFKKLINELLLPVYLEISTKQVDFVRSFAIDKVKQWNLTVQQRESETEKYIWSHVPKRSDKSSFLSSFRYMFNLPSESALDAADAIGNVNAHAPATEFEAQSAVLVSKLKGMESLVSIELVIEVMDLCRTSINRLRLLGLADAKRCQQIFCIFVKVIGETHIKPAFERALNVLNSYDPKKYGRLMVSVGEGNLEKVAVEPLVVFTELVNVGDIVQQMTHVFFEEELINTKLIRKSDFGAMSVNAKRKFEQMLDDMLAAGLSRGIDVLMDQVEFTLKTEQLGSDYLPLPNNTKLGPTTACEKVIAVVKSHLDLLKESIEKQLFDVFQHEVGVRLYHTIQKHIKTQTISEEGAVVLISDMNAYYAFVLTLKQRSIQPYYETLKQIAQLFLISKQDAKQIGAAISDSARYNNLVTTEDLVEFVKRRRDWPSIKSKVEKSVYGIFDCCVS